MNRTKRGFSLVESLIAVMVVAIGMTATLSMLTRVRINNALEQERARAHQIVIEEMDTVRHELYSRITGGRNVTVWDYATPDDPSDDTTGVLQVVMRDPNGALLANAPVPAVRIQIEVTLTWNPRGSQAGRTVRETVMTYIAP